MNESISCRRELLLIEPKCLGFSANCDYMVFLIQDDQAADGKFLNTA